MRRGLLLAAACALLAAPPSPGASLEDCERLLRKGDEERAARCFEKASLELLPRRRRSRRDSPRSGTRARPAAGSSASSESRRPSRARRRPRRPSGAPSPHSNAAGDPRGEAVARATLADFLSRRRRFAEAEQELRRADALAARSGRPDAVTQCESRRRSSPCAARTLSAGSRGWTRGRTPLHASGDDELLANWHETRAMLLWMAGRYPESLEAYRRQIEVLERLGDTRRIADVLANMAFSTTDPGEALVRRGGARPGGTSRESERRGQGALHARGDRRRRRGPDARSSGPGRGPPARRRRTTPIDFHGLGMWLLWLALIATVASGVSYFLAFFRQYPESPLP